ncbi:lipoprotein insertase outer membrane protein LolB [Rhodocyclaceae bacterium SMB388]
MKRRGFTRALAFLAGLAALLLSACSTAPSSPDAPALVSRAAASAFKLEGRVSASDTGRAASGRLAWSHAPEFDEWTVFSPLGQVLAQLVSTPAGAVLQTGDGRSVHADSVQEMLPEILGVAVPVNGLAHWVQAVPRAGARVLLADDFGRPVRVFDSGWLIEYREYASEDAAAAVRRIDASRGDARIRLIVDEWTPFP